MLNWRITLLNMISSGDFLKTKIIRAGHGLWRLSQFFPWFNSKWDMQKKMSIMMKVHFFIKEHHCLFTKERHHFVQLSYSSFDTDSVDTNAKLSVMNNGDQLRAAMCHDHDHPQKISQSIRNLAQLSGSTRCWPPTIMSQCDNAVWDNAYLGNHVHW